MKKTISLESFIQAIKNKKYSNDIKLEVEGKFLKTTNQLIIKKLVVPEKLLNDLGMEKIMIDGPTTKNPPKPSLRELVENLGSKIDNVDSRLDIIEKDVSAIKSLPTIQNELNTQKRVKKLKIK